MTRPLLRCGVITHEIAERDAHQADLLAAKRFAMGVLSYASIDLAQLGCRHSLCGAGCHAKGHKSNSNAQFCCSQASNSRPQAAIPA